MIQNILSEQANQCGEAFAKEFVERSKSGEWASYLNGNTICELNKKDGTLIMTTPDDDYQLTFPTNIDMNISNKCMIGCPFCYQNCTPTGKEADLKAYMKNKNSFLYTLESGTELAINGNEPLHPDIKAFLNWCKKRGIFANLTVNETTLLKNKTKLDRWIKSGLIHGLGISPSKYSQEMLSFAESHPTVVVHTIAGITTVKQYIELFSKGIKVLVLGYKLTGRGINFKKNDQNRSIAKQKERLKELLHKTKDFISLVSFDNLAIEQLNPKEILDLSDEDYRMLYRGDDGNHTMFIDLVKGTFAKNSIQPAKKQYPLTNNITEMFSQIKNEAKKEK